MVKDLWDYRAELLIGKPFKHDAPILPQIPQNMQKDPLVRAFLWKLSLYKTTRYPHKDREALKEELINLWEDLKEKYNLPPDYLRKKT